MPDIKYSTYPNIFAMAEKENCGLILLH